MPKSPDYIMTQTLFDQMNGTTYQEHIVIIAGKRIPSDLHDAVRQAKSGDIALEILTKNNIPWSHKYN